MKVIQPLALARLFLLLGLLPLAAQASCGGAFCSLSIVLQNGHRSGAVSRALTANAPDQLFSWDITYLPTRVRGLYFYLYLFMDIFSRDFPLVPNFQWKPLEQHIDLIGI